MICCFCAAKERIQNFDVTEDAEGVVEIGR